VKHYDVAIAGAGILGASAAWRLAQAGAKTLLLEMEARPGYHTTGRSAALYETAYGPEIIRRLTLASGPFFRAPPQGFAEHKLLTPRGTMFVAGQDGAAAFEQAQAEALPGTVAEIPIAKALELCPVLRPEWTRRVLYNADAEDMDVAAIHQGYLRGFKAAGGTLACDAGVRGLVQENGGWRIDTGAGVFEAANFVNAFVFETAHDAATWPFVCEIAEKFYFKPDAGLIFASPADETPSPPCDAQPEEIDIAECAARIEEATSLEIRRIRRKWAGLRCFVADKKPVVGRDPAAENFVWLAAPGGYGIMTSPALGRLCAALVLGRDMPADLAENGVDSAELAPARLARYKVAR
jgi:D-arginine dehydrogenase